jgi:2-polyprenyl-3-methyl-5-hydroxy-6-metoxy-1,4-benzoquinol methylase
MAQFLPASYQRVLEVGCGGGGFAARLDPKAELWGIEPFADAAAKSLASGRFFKIITTPWRQAMTELPQGYFDLVVCNDVIEHMEDHYFFLESLKPYLSRSASIVVSLPNIRHAPIVYDLLVKGDWTYQDYGILDRTHLRFFTRRTVLEWLDRCGFKADVVKPIDRVYFDPRSVRGAACRLAIAFAPEMAYRQIAFRASFKD